MPWTNYAIVIVIKGVGVSQSVTSGRIFGAATEWVVDEPVIGFYDGGGYAS
jgi:hypothetical protein